MTGQRVLAALVLGVLLAACACSSGPPQRAGASPPSPPPAAAPAAPPVEQRSFIASGPIVVEHQLDVAAQRVGVVSTLAADTGTPVKKGQLLARLDDRQLTADRDAAEAKLKSVDADLKNWEAETKVQEADLDRAEQMMKAQLITQQELDHARYKVIASRYEVERERQDLRQAEAALRSLQLELEKTRILAPFDGVVARRYVRQGQQVAIGERLFWVTAVAPMRVRFTLPESFFGKVKNGQEVMVGADAAPEFPHKARIISVSPVVDPASGMVEAVAELIGPASGLRPGMTAKVRIDAAR